MSELLKAGPLDIAREINAEAANIDYWVDNIVIAGGQAALEDYKQQLSVLDSRSLHLGAEVIMFGPSTTMSFGDDGSYMPESYTNTFKKVSPTPGYYHGFTLRYVFDTAHQTFTWRACHMLQTANYSRTDLHGHYHETTEFHYFPVANSDFIPRYPINAHSLRDLRSDGATKLIDEIVFDETIGDKMSLLHKLGNYAVNTLEKYSIRGLSLDEANQQRVSYLNSLDILSDIRVVSKDFVLGTLSDYQGDDTLAISDDSTAFEIRPEIFVVADRYIREPDNRVRIREKPELFVAGEIAGNRAVLTPARSLIAVR